MMSLHPAAQAVLDQLAAAPPLHTLSVAQAREFARQLSKSAGPGEPVARVEDRDIRSRNCNVTARFYTPEGPGPFPIYVYFHGGGWVIGDLDTEDASCRAICNAVTCIVVSVNYRHAPEHKFPTAVHDAYEATSWIARHAAGFGGDASRLTIGGTSAGGNLAAVVALLARERQGPRINSQVLITPATDFAFDTASHRECATGYGLERSTMDWFLNHYLPDPQDRADVYASPLRAADLRGLPPALIITAQYDPLRDEGKAYADRLRAAGVTVTYRCCEGMIHLYLGQDAAAIVAAQLRERLAPGC
jgi:acetyl esterase